MSFKQEIDQCKDCDCGEKRLIVNRTRWLCDQKNKERLGKPKSSKSSLGRSLSKGLKAKSSKRAATEKRYIQVKEDIAEERGFHCNCCGLEDSRLSFSHLVPRSRRADLIDEPKNIVIHCMTFGDVEGCHERWERADSTMNDFDDNMNKVKELDREYYEILLSKKEKR